MRVLLIAANTETISMPVLPLGLACVAEAAERAGHDVSLVNMLRVETAPGWDANGHAAVIEKIETFRPAIIGISVRNIDDQNMDAPKFMLEPIRDVVRACRRSAPGVPIVLGGAGYSIFPAAALAYLQADFGICGDGEEAFCTLLSRLEQEGDVAGLPGLYRRECEFAPVPPARSTDLDRLPSADPRRLLAFAPGDCWVPVQSRRGCPLDCSYCSTASIEGRQVRRRSPELVAHDLAGARALGLRRFYFVDNTFNLPESYALKLCEEIGRLDLDLEWRAIVYPRALSAALARAMRRAGCIEASLGFESGSARMLKALNKRFGLDDVRTACARLHDEGIRRNGFLLLGGPGETRQSVDESIAFADSLHLEMVKVTFGIRIYPHTPLHRAALAEGVVSPDDDLLFPRFYLAEGLEGTNADAVRGS